MICQTHLELTYWLIGDGLKIVHFGEKYVCETIVRTISSRAKVTKNDHPLPYRYFFEIFFLFRLLKRGKVAEQAEVLFGLYIE